MNLYARQKLFIYLVLFGSGLLLGYVIHGLISVEFNPYLQGILAGSSLVAVVGVVFEVLPFLLRWYDKREEERIRQDKLILEDLENWMKNTTFTIIQYNLGKFGFREHKDPTLRYLDEDVKILKKYGAYDIWEKGKTVSKQLKKDAEKAIKEFHVIVDKKLENISLKKSLEIGTLSEPYYSFPKVCEAVYEKNDEGVSNFFGILNGFLVYGDDKIGKGKNVKLEDLKTTIEALINDETVRTKIRNFKEVEEKLYSLEPFSDFKNKIIKIKEHYDWNHKLR